MGGGGSAPTPAAVRGAFNRAMACIKRGGKWVTIDKDSKQIEFRRDRRIEVTDFITTHRRTKEESDAPKAIGTSAASGVAETHDVTPEKVPVVQTTGAARVDPKGATPPE